MSARHFLGTIGFAGGAGLIVFGLTGGGALPALGGVLALAVGLVASFEKRQCGNCGSRAWVSSRRADHCIRCGASYRAQS